VQKILFISRDTSQTGATILLLRLIEILKPRFEIAIIIAQGEGELYGEFQKVSNDCFTFPKRYSGFLKRTRNKIAYYKKIKELKKILNGVDFIISNTITNGSMIKQVKQYSNAPVISYVHELGMASSYFATLKDIESVLSLSQHFFVPCKSVKNFLEKNLAVSSQKISYLNYYIPAHFNISRRERSDVLKNKTFVVGGIGTIDWRKAPEVFILTATRLIEKYPQFDIIFKWKGGNKNSLEYTRLMHDVALQNISSKVEFIEASPDVSQFIETIDVLLLTSREDPYPLVVLETASFKKPTICFKDAGGAQEFVENDAGTVVSYMAIEEVVNAIAFYYKNNDLLQKHGQEAYRKVVSRHQNKEKIIEQFISQLHF